jgi:hypothetical protein
MDAEGVFFVDDPFIQYFTGMVYRVSSELADADVSFRVAMAGYEELAGDYGIGIPGPLRCDAAHTARMLGDAGADTSMLDCPDASLPDTGELNLFLECGYVAHLQERNLVLPVFKDDDAEDVDAFAEVLAAREGVTVAQYRTNSKVDYVLKVAMPVLVPTPVPWEYAVVTPVRRLTDRTAGNPRFDETAFAGIVENVDAYAAADFEEAYGRVLFRTIVRGLTKYAAKQGVSKKDEGLGWLVNWFNVATETADTRTWSTLPEKILMSRLVLPAGVYDLQVDLYNSLGRRVDRLIIEEVAVTNGRATFLNHRIF